MSGASVSTRGSVRSKRAIASNPTLKYSLCIAVIHCSCTGKSITSAFAPIKDTLNKNKKNCGISPGKRGNKSTSEGIFLKRNTEDSFVVRMASHQSGEVEIQEDPPPKIHADGPNLGITEFNEKIPTLKRRAVLSSMLMASAAGLTSSVTGAEPANAFDNKSFPQDLDFVNDDSTINLQSIRSERIAAQKSRAKQSKRDLIKQPLVFKDKKDVIGSGVWGGALWLLLGSRSNPLVKPLANALYDENTRKGAWLKDRNEGLFAPFPAAFSILMGIIFLTLGVLTDRALLFAAEGESTVVLQLAGVSLIGGGSLELGRIASGEKMKTRFEAERDENLANEFEEFAKKRLIVNQGGSCHRSEVITSFRRNFGKYRVENDEYPLGDLEIERLLRNWNKRNGNLESMSSAGFLKNVKINEQAKIK